MISGTATNVLCYAGTTGAINITVTGGTGAYTYNWGSGVTTEDRTNLIAGEYTVIVTDANGCTATQTYTITQASALSITSSTTNNINCYAGANGNIDFAITGGTAPYSYLWNTSATTKSIANLTSGAYSVAITDANGCTLSQSYTLTQPVAALTASAVATSANCVGGTGSINLTVSGGTTSYTYLWSNAQTTEDITSLTSGTYDVTVTDLSLIHI